MNVLTPVLCADAAQVVLLDGAHRHDPVAVLDARAQRRALGAHRDLDVGRVGQPRDQARLQRARELGPQVRRQPHQLDRHRRHQVRILARELARDLVHDVVDQLEEVDASLRPLHQLFDLAGRRRARRLRGGSTCTRPAAPRAGRGLDHRRAACRRRTPVGLDGSAGAAPRDRCAAGPAVPARALAGLVRRPGAARRSALRAARPLRLSAGGAARRRLRARAPAAERRRDQQRDERASRTQSPPGIGRRGGPGRDCLPR